MDACSASVKYCSSKVNYRCLFCLKTCLHLFTFSFCKSFFTSSSHLNLSLSTFLLLSTWKKNFCYCWSILISHSNPFPFNICYRSGVLQNSPSSWVVLVLHAMFSVTGLYAQHNVFLSYIFDNTLYFSASECVLHLHSRIDFNNVLYILIFVILLTVIDLKIGCKPYCHYIMIRCYCFV
jgi:hypothetical protein